MTEKTGLWALLVFLLTLAAGQWGIIGKNFMGQSSQAMRPDHCFYLPQSISCGGGNDWYETIDNSDSARH